MTRKHGKRALSLALSLLIMAGLFAGVIVPSANAAGITYDYSVTAAQNTANQIIGDPGSSYARLTFLRVFDNVTLDKIELNITKPAGTSGQPDLAVSVYAKNPASMAPTGEALTTGTVPGSAVPVSSDTAAAVVADMTDAALTPGDYVVVVSVGHMPAGFRYSWYCTNSGGSSTPADANYSFIFNSQNGTTWPGNGYAGYRCGMKAICYTGAPAVAQLVVDYSFNVTPPGGTIGRIGNAAFTRYNYVEFAAETTVGTVDVLLTKFAPKGATNPWSDVRLDIFPSDASHKPTGAAVKSVVAPSANITGAPFAISVNQLLPAGGYCFAITPLTGSNIDVDNAYFWPRRNGTPTDADGGYTDQAVSGWNLQTNARHWMKINHTPTGGAAATIDYTVPLKGSGFGAGTNDEMERAQVFVPTITGSLTSVSVFPNANVVPGTTGFVLTDMMVNIYECDNATDQKPTTLLGTVRVPKGDLPLNGGPFSVDFSAAGIHLEAGRYYAAAITQYNLAPNGDSMNEHYLFPTGTHPDNPGNAKKFFKKNASGWVPEALGTGWIQVNMTPSASTVIDFSHSNTGGGLGAGHKDEQWRFQTFTADQSGTLESVDLHLNRHYVSGQPYRLPLRDLVVAVYDVNASGAPTGSPIKQVIVPVANLPFSAVKGAAGGQITVNLDCGGIVKDKRYAVAITQNANPLPQNGGGDNVEGDYFTWPAASVAAAVAEKAGKMNTSGSWVVEAVGTFWLKVKLNDKVQAEPVPRSIELTPAGPLNLAAGSTQTLAAVVKDQYGQVMNGQTISWSSTNQAAATVSGGVITAVARGTATIRAEIGTTSQTVSVTVYQSVANKITGAPNLSILMGGTATLNYDVMDDMKNIRPGDKSGITFEVLTPNVVALNGTTVTTLAPGAAQILVKFGALKKYININVYQSSETLVTPTAGMVITANVKFAPGAYTLSSGLVVGASNITIDGNGAVIRYSGTPSYNGTPRLGLSGDGYNNVTVKNLSVTNFNTGLEVKNATGWTVEYCDFSNNYTDPSYGWGDGKAYGATNLTNFNNGVLRYCNGSNNWNGVNLNFSNKNKIYNNDFGICSNVPLRLWGSSFNEIYDNCFNWGIRCDPGETHARDSTSSLFEYTSNYNYIARNDFIHGGDGIFIRPLHGAPPMGNYFEGNDTSWANNNAVESWAPGNVYVGNKANYSSYGFWLGGSDFTYLIDNQVYNNGGNGGGMSNAPEGFGNAGVSVVNGVSSHFLMMGNDVQNNFGPALAIKYNNAANPAYHWVVQNNLLKNNLNDPRGYKSYGVYTQWAQWVDIQSNDISNNGDVQLKQDGNTSNIKLNGANTATTTVRMPTLNVSASPAITFNHADKYMADIPQQLKDAPYGIVRIMNVSVVAGKAVTFNAGATDPQNLPLSYRWDFGDNEIEIGATVSKIYTTPGIYRAGVTVSNGQTANLQGMIVTVVAEGTELGTESAASDWTVSGGTGLTGAGLTEDTVRHIAGSKAIRVKAKSGVNFELTYPAAKNLSVDMSAFKTLGFYMDVEVERGLDKNFALPIVRLCKDESNYINYLPSLFFTAPINMPTSEPRYAYQYLELSLNASNSQFTRSVVGAVNLNEIKYIKIIAGPQSQAAESSFAFDGMMLSTASAAVAMTGNLAVPGSATGISDSQGTGDVQAPLSNSSFSNPGALARYTSAAGAPAYYGAQFLQPRYVDTLEAYYYSLPDVDPGIAKPTAVAVEYFDGTNWKPVTGLAAPAAPLVNKNTYTFDKVLAQSVRVVLTAASGKSVSVYGFRAYDSQNLLGKDGVSVTSSGVDTVNISQVSVIVNKKTLTVPGALPLSDLKVMLYAAEGDKIVGQPLATKIVPQADVNSGAITDVALDYTGLVPGNRYAIAVSQTTYSMAVGGDLQSHYLFPSRGIGVNEYYGKINGGGGVVPEALGTAFIKVVTNVGTIDYMGGATTASGGFGAGQRDEQLRYQTFTIPANTATLTTDAKIDAANGWTNENQTGGAYWLQYDLGTARQVGKVNLLLGTPEGAQLPATVNVEYWDGTAWKPFASSQKVTSRMELEGFTAATSKLKVTFTGTDGTLCRVREVEAFSDVPKATSLKTGTPVVVTVKRGRTLQLNPEITPAGIPLNILYTSLNPSVATVDSATGLITGVKAGMTAIMLKAQDGSGLSAQVAVTVIS